MPKVTTAERYQEAGRVAVAFWEWRHKLMTFTFTAIAALVVAFGWLLGRDAKWLVADLPLVVAMIVCLIARMLDARVGEALKGAYKTGGHLEPRDDLGDEPEDDDGPHRRDYGGGPYGDFEWHRRKDLPPASLRRKAERTVVGVLAPRRKEAVLPMTVVLGASYGLLAVGLAALAIAQAIWHQDFVKSQPRQPGQTVTTKAHAVDGDASRNGSG